MPPPKACRGLLRKKDLQETIWMVHRLSTKKSHLNQFLLQYERLSAYWDHCHQGISILTQEQSIPKY